MQCGHWRSHLDPVTEKAGKLLPGKKHFNFFILCPQKNRRATVKMFIIEGLFTGEEAVT